MDYVLDTNVVLYLLGGRLTKPLPSGTFAVSVITEMELLSYPSLTEAEAIRIRTFLNQVSVIGIEEDVKNYAIALRQKYRLKLPDAIVVATAVSLNAILLSNDVQLNRVTEVQAIAVDIVSP